MLMKRPKNILISQFKSSIKEAYNRGNVPLLNDISETILNIVAQNQAFRIHNRHLEPAPIYHEANQLIDLYSQVIKLIYRMEFRS